MKIGLGCDILCDAVTELLQRAMTVRRSLARIQARELRCPANPAVAETFSDLAAAVNHALADVNHRLGIVDEVLQEISGEAVDREAQFEMTDPVLKRRREEIIFTEETFIS